MKINYQAIGRLLAQRRQRERLSLRKVEKITGISASTLNRIEHGKSCDTEQVATLAAWFGVEMERFTSNGQPKKNVPATVKAILLADKNLDPESAEALGNTFSVLYRQLTKRAGARS